MEDGQTYLLGTTGEMFYCTLAFTNENEDGEEQTDQEYITAITEALMKVLLDCQRAFRSRLEFL